MKNKCLKIVNERLTICKKQKLKTLWKLIKFGKTTIGMVNFGQLVDQSHMGVMNQGFTGLQTRHETYIVA